MKKKSDTEWDDHAADIARGIDEEESRVFSDDDLKQLKKLKPRDQDGIEIRPDVLKALLARLEASEAFGDNAALAYPSLKLGYDYKEWRRKKAAK